MGILGTFLAFGWLGGNLIKESINENKNMFAVNDRIYSKGAHYYDSITQRRVVRRFEERKCYGGELIAAWYDAKTGWPVYCQAEEDSKNCKKEIEIMKEIRDAAWMKEAEEKKLRFAKVVLPYKPCLRKVTIGYIDRMDPNSGKDDNYIIMKNNIMYHAKYENGSYKGSYACDSKWHLQSFAHPDDEYFESDEELRQKKTQELEERRERSRQEKIKKDLVREKAMNWWR